MIISCWPALFFMLVTWNGVPVHSKANIDGNIVNANVIRKIDLSSSLAKVNTIVTVENTGKQNVDSFLFTVSSSEAGHLAYIGATAKEPLTVQETEVDVDQKGARFFKINLAKTLAPGKSEEVTVSTSFTHVLQPFPAEIKQADKQLVRYKGNLYYYSPYQTASQKTMVILASSNVESYTKTKPVSKSESTITYGPYEKQDPFGQEELAVHYENNKPFLAVTTMTRLIEVSHWGNIAVEETYDLRHTGANLKGQFSRYDYQRQPNPFSSVKSFKTILPASASDVYYRDEIGNISTSNMREMDDAVELELKPRFPLFGGWKTHYVVGYNVPSYQYLWTDGGSQYKLKMPFVDHVFDDQVIDEVIVKIILPEGTQVQDLTVPFKYERNADEVEYTYLDSIGRPVIILHNTNLVEEHIQEFELKYTFNKIMLLREPFMVFGFFYFLFLFVIVYVRMDFSIAHDEAAESRMKVDSYIEQAQSILDRRSALYQSYDDAINKYKANKELSAYQSQKKRVDADHKTLTQELNNLQSKLKQEGADGANDKLTEIQKQDTTYRDSLGYSFSLAEKLVNGKVAKDHYLKQEDQANTARTELLNKMETLAAQL